MSIWLNKQMKMIDHIHGQSWTVPPKLHRSNGHIPDESSKLRHPECGVFNVIF